MNFTDPQALLALMGAFFGVLLLLMLVLYIYSALVLMTIAKKTNTPNPWLAWIPVANFFLMVNIAQKPWWWTLLILIPYIGVVFVILIWVYLFQRVNKPWWYALLIMIPIVNLFILWDASKTPSTN